MSSQIQSVLDVGTSRTVVLIGEPARDAPAALCGRGEIETTGMRKSRVFDREQVGTAVGNALDAAGEVAHVDVDEVVLLCSCGDVEHVATQSTVPVDSADGLVSPQAKDAATAGLDRYAAGAGREILSHPRLYFTLDSGAEEIRDPVAMRAQTLTAHGLAVHVDRNALGNLVDTVEEAEVQVTAKMFTGMAAAYAVLDDQQKKDGALAIDFGAGSTSWCGYRNGYPACAGSIAVGGDHATNDLMVAFKTGSRKTAEALKIEAGSAVLDPADRGRRVELEPLGGPPDRSVSRFAVAQVVNARMEELLEILHGRLRDEGMLGMLGGGVTLCGRGARLHGLPKLVERVFSAPCRLAELHTGYAAIDRDPLGYATAWGGLVQAVRLAQSRAKPRRGLGWFRGPRN